MEEFFTPLESYPEKKLITKVTDKVLLQLKNTREAMLSVGGAYSEALEAGKYINDEYTAWEVYDVSGLDNEVTRVVLFSEIDDGSYSFHFKSDSLEPDYYYYEN